MTILRTTGVVLTIAGLGAFAAPGAFAEDYYTGIKSLVGKIYAIEGTCLEIDSLGAHIDDAEAGRSVSVRTPEDEDGAGWTKVKELCAAGSPIKIKVRVDDDHYADFKLEYEAQAIEGEETLSLGELALALNAEVASIDTVAGIADLENDDLSYSKMTRDEADPSPNLVFFNEMDPHRTIEFLGACFQTCERVIFKLKPLEFAGTFSLTLYATDWLLPKAGKTKG